MLVRIVLSPLVVGVVDQGYHPRHLWDFIHLPRHSVKKEAPHVDADTNDDGKLIAR